MKVGIKNKDRFAKRIKTKRLLMIAFLSLFLTPYSLIVSQNTVEQEQQFTYYWYAAKQAINAEKYDEALTLLEFCRLIKPDDGQTLTFLGTMYDALRMPERAMKLFKEAYEADPDGQWKNYLERLLQQAVNEGQWKQAIKIQDEIDKHQEYDAASAYTHGRLYLFAGKPKKALAAIDKYLETDPTHLPLLTFRVEIMEQTKAKSKDLYTYYKRILALNPGHLMILNNYAYHLATHGGDLKEAERMSAITIREEPDNAVYLDTYGWILHLQGQDELALFFLQRALSNASENNNEEIQKHINAIKK